MVADPKRLRLVEIVPMVAIPAALMVASHTGLLPVPPVEAWGFATGGVCVWLTVRQNIWNFPIGLANNVFFFVLFMNSRLFADMGLQVVYFALGVWGWWNWLHGGENRTELRVSRTSPREWIALAALVPLFTWGLREVLILVNGAAPFWDSLTTILCLAAQVLLNRKRVENWAFWIVADLIYIPLYWSRGLHATAVLYGVFLVMCILGVRDWVLAERREAEAQA